MKYINFVLDIASVILSIFTIVYILGKRKEAEEAE